LTWKPDLVVAFPGGDGTADIGAESRSGRRTGTAFLGEE
jgi:hypothetical protein